jgi:hypothetical protein
MRTGTVSAVVIISLLGALVVAAATAAVAGVAADGPPIGGCSY